MSRVVHFNISAQDPDRAIRFYSDVFGWQIQKWDGPSDYWLIKTGPDDQPGIDGGMGRTEAGKQPTTVNTIDVPSVDEFTAKITANGGKIVFPKMPIPGVGYLAFFEDTEGNHLSILQPDASAK